LLVNDVAAVKTDDNFRTNLARKDLRSAWHQVIVVADYQNVVTAGIVYEPLKIPRGAKIPRT